MAGSPSRRLVSILILFACVAAPAAAGAQTTSSTTGAVNGKVTDRTNAVLPGVTVTISSPSLMGTRNVVTGEDGTYRFAAVPPGDDPSRERAGDGGRRQAEDEDAADCGGVAGDCQGQCHEEAGERGTLSEVRRSSCTLPAVRTLLVGSHSFF